MKWFLLPLALSLLATGQPSPAVDPDEVLITEDKALVAGCTSLGEVKARSGMGALLVGDIAMEEFTKIGARLREQAAAMGGNMVLLEKASSLFVSTAGGTAYQCPAAVIKKLRLAETRRKQRSERSMDLPERAVDVGSGFVGLQAGVMNRPVQRVPFRPIPTAFILGLRNETSEPLYVVAKLTLKETPEEKSINLFPGKMKSLSWDSYGIPADRDLPLEITFYANEQRTNALSAEKTSLFFASDNLKGFHSIVDSRRATLFIIGWKEMFNRSPNLTGTRADPELQQDIAWTLYREESKGHRDCKHAVVAAAAGELNPKALQTTFPRAKADLVDAFAKREGALEIWRVKSCEDVTAYRIGLFTAPDGATDFLVTPDVAPKP